MAVVRRTVISFGLVAKINAKEAAGRMIILPAVSLAANAYCSSQCSILAWEMYMLKQKNPADH